jgi:predicted flap endonuclease-1-like 5' DNA nuclease
VEDHRVEDISNERIAEKLLRVAELLDSKGGNTYRARSYRRAAESIRQADQPMTELYEEKGLPGLKGISGIGEKLGGAIAELLDSGRLGILDRLESEQSPEDLLSRAAGIGEKLAHRLYHELGIETLEELERIAWEGKLQQIEGVGEEKAEGIRDALAGMLSRSAGRRARQRISNGTDGEDAPDVATILDVDEEYRTRAEKGALRKIAPKRFNPDHEKWLPILNTRRGEWEFTALFSNTARAHELGKTHDWVVVYYEKDGREDQNTVVTGGRGPLKGKRLVRGREAECREHYGL